MKISRSIFWSFAVLLAAVTLSSFVPAQQAEFRKFLHRSPETRANIITTVMENRLALDEDQVEKAYQINLKYAKMIQPYLQSEEVAQENMEVLTGLNKKRKEELMSLLTPEQTRQVEVIRKKWISRLETILSCLKENEVTNP
jgi:hypothetical protein